jgi:uncharacterized membrane protein
VGPAARVVIGVAIGAALLVWSERFHARGYFLFSHTLKVVSVGILYLSIWAASQTYSLVGDGTAFAAMTIVTAALVVLAVRHRSEFIAGLAMTSGFLTPVLLSTGTNREVALFSYVALLRGSARWWWRSPGRCSCISGGTRATTRPRNWRAPPDSSRCF